jgi:hypothetical protein
MTLKSEMADNTSSSSSGAQIQMYGNSLWCALPKPTYTTNVTVQQSLGNGVFGFDPRRESCFMLPSHFFESQLPKISWTDLGKANWPFGQTYSVRFSISKESHADLAKVMADANHVGHGDNTNSSPFTYFSDLEESEMHFKLPPVASKDIPDSRYLHLNRIEHIGVRVWNNDKPGAWLNCEYTLTAKSPGAKVIELDLDNQKLYEELLTMFTMTMGIRGTVFVKRSVLYNENVRIDVDDVADLGKFVGLRYVSSKEHPIDKANDTVEKLMKDMHLTNATPYTKTYAEDLAAKYKWDTL